MKRNEYIFTLIFLLLNGTIWGQDLVLTFNNNHGDVGGTLITLPISGGAYDVDVDNDGIYGDTDLDGQQLDNLVGTSHIRTGYAVDFTIRIRPSDSNNNQLRIAFANGNRAQKLVWIESWGTGIVWTSMANAFQGCINMNISESAGAPNLSMVSSMRQMFWNATSLNRDLSSWNTASVTDMHQMFTAASSFNGDVSTWNTSNVTTMHEMFNGASSFNQDVGSWDVSSIDGNIAGANGFHGFLTGASNFSAANYDKLLIGWSAQTVYPSASFGAPSTTYCTGAEGRSILTGTNGWTITGDSGEVCTDLILKFDTTRQGLSTTIELPISDGAYDVDINNDGVYGDSDNTAKNLDNLTGTHTITFASGGEKTIRIRPSSSNTSKKLRIAYANGNDGHDLSSIEQWGTGILWTSMEAAFQGCIYMSISASAGAPNLSQVTSMRSMFHNNFAFSADFSSWDVSNVTDMTSMFEDGMNFNGNLSTWNVSKVTTMEKMFKGTSFLQNINSWNVSNVTNMSQMFYNNPGFNQPLNQWDVSKVTDMSNMFSGAVFFNQDLSGWNVSSLMNATSMFNSVNTSFSEAHYNSLLTAWSAITTLKNGVAFGAPPKSYCDGFTGRSILTGTFGWNITGDIASNCAPMILTFDTSLGTGGTTITLPMSGGAYDVDIDDDGTFELTDLENTQIINIGGVARVQTIRIRPSSSNSDKRLRILYNNAVDGQNVNDALKLTSIDSWGDIIWTSMANAFEGCVNMNIAASAGAPNLSSVTNMVFMFAGAAKLDQDLSTWNVSTITNMQAAFYKASIFNGNVSTWNVSNVTQMGYVFSRAAKFNQPLNGWDVSKVTSTTGMFEHAVLFDQPLNSWNTSNVTSMNSMFIGASAFNQDLNNWNVSKVTNMYQTFSGASKFNGNISTWNVSNVTTMHSTFFNASEFNQDLNNWNVSKVTNMFQSFSEASKFNGNISTWNVENVTNMSNMFSGASVFDQDLSNWNVSKVVSMNYMFNDASEFNGNITTWNTASVTQMAATFRLASKFNQDISGWNTSNVTLMNAMFSVATLFNQDIGGWNVSKVTTMANMFQSTDDFNQDISTWNTSGITASMAFMFNNAKAFNQNIGGWNVSGATNMTSMFNGAKKFNQDLSLWNTGNVTDMSVMFAGATDFNGNVSTWNTSKVTNMIYMFSNATSFNQDIGTWNVGSITSLVGVFNNATSFNQDIGTWNVESVTNMTGMFNNVTGFSTENYDKLLIGWSSQAVQNGVVFRAPSTNYCDGAAARDLLDRATNGGKNWDISGDLGLSCPDLVLTFNTTLGDPGNTTIIIPMVDDGVGRYDLDIDNDGDYADDGDGGALINVIGTQTIDFGSGNEGEKTIRIRPNPTSNSSNQLRIAYADGNSSQKLLRIDNWGTTIVWTSMANAFQGCSNMDISATAGVPDLSMVTDMNFIFSGANSLNQDLSGWNVSTITTMQGAFFEATIFDGNVSTWNTSNVTNMGYVFGNASAFNQSLDSWNVSKVLYMSGMFQNASKFNQNLNSWDVSSVTAMISMFDGAIDFNENITSWNTGSVTDMRLMFNNATKFDQPINGWNVSSATVMSNMFQSATTFKQDLNSWNISNATDIRAMFVGATSFNGNISNWNTSKVQFIGEMFSGATAFNGDISGWNTSSATYMAYMFFNASAFNQDVSSWNVESVTNMTGMFNGAASFTAGNYDKLLIGWSAQSVQSGVVFGAPATNYCDGAAARDLLDRDTNGGKNWDISGDLVESCPDLILTFNTTLGDPGNTTIVVPVVDDGVGRYDIDIDNDGDYTDTGDGGALVNVIGTQTIDFGSGNEGEKTIRIRPNSTSNSSGQLRIAYANGNSPQKLLSIDNWGTTIVWTSMQNAFQGCTNMNIAASAGVPDLSMVTSMESMFSGASTFNQDINGWNVSNVTNIKQLFAGASAFNQNLNSWNVSNVTLMQGVFFNAVAFNGNISTWNTASVNNMGYMFSGSSVFNGNISSWNTENLVLMGNMFSNTGAFNQDINGWNTSKVTEMTSVFLNASEFNQNLNSWNVSSVTLMDGMFNGASKFNGNISTWNTSNVTAMNSMFSGASLFDQDLNLWNVSGVTNMSYMFAGASAFNKDLNSWNVSSVTLMTNMLASANAFNGNITTWNTASVTSMAAVFLNAVTFNNDISSWNVESVTDMTSMFSGATSFNSENYDKLLIGWATQTVQTSGVAFGAPSATFCDGETAKGVLTTANWTITGDLGISCTDHFVLTFDTTKDDPGNTTIVLPITTGAYDVDIDNDRDFTDTGDGGALLNVSGKQTITFSVAGTHQIRIRPNRDNNANKELRINFENDASNSPQKLISIDEWSTNIVWTSFENAFQGCANVAMLASAGAPNLNSVTNMSFMFENATSVSADISSWSIGNVTHMANFLTGATSFTSGNYDSLLTGWAAQTVQSGVAFGAPPVGYCTGTAGRAKLTGGTNKWLITGDLDPSCGDMILTFNTELGDPGNKTIMLPMSVGSYDVDFNNDGVYNDTDFATTPLSLTNLTETKTITFENPGIYTIRIRPNPTSNSNGQLRIAYANGNGAQKLTTIHNWGAANWTSMEDAFNGCTNMNISTLADPPNLSAVSSMRNMFAGATTMNTDISAWNVSTITDMSGMFNGASSFNSDVNTWNVSNVTNMQEMFNNANAFNRDISGWNITSVTNMTDFLTGATGFSTAYYNNLLTVWSAQAVQSGVSFGAPPKNYCGGSTGRDNLTDPLPEGHNWTITGDLGTSCTDEMILTLNTEEISVGFWPFDRDYYFIRLPMGSGSYDVDMNNNGSYNDIDARYGHSLNGLNGEQIIHFNSGGSRTIRIRPSQSNSEKKLSISYGTISDYVHQRYLLEIHQWGDNIVWTSMERAFEGCYNLTISANAGVPNLSQVTNMSKMFKHARIVGNTDLNAWNVSTVTNMQEMFNDTNNFNQDLNSWNVSNVTNMAYMFHNMGFNGNISSWNTSNVTSMANMFHGASSFNQDLSTWNVSGVTTMNDMFLNANSFSTINYDKLLNAWASRSVQIGVLFGAPPTSYCEGAAGKSKLESTPNNWTISGDSGSTCAEFVLTFDTTRDDPGNTTIMLPIGNYTYDVDINNDGVFTDTDFAAVPLSLVGLTGLTTITFDTPGIKTIRIRPSSGNTNKELSIAYDNSNDAQKLIQIDRWGNEIVWTTMENAFRGCTNVTLSASAGIPDLSALTNVSRMFNDARAFNQDISSWDVSKVTDMSYMFYNARIFNQDISSWDVSKVTTMRYMFNFAAVFNQPLNSWNVSNVEDMFGMFSNASIFDQDLHSWNTSKVTNMASMFATATAFNGNISTWNTSSVEQMYFMFSSASTFNQHLNSWDVSSVSSISSIFREATSFNGNISNWNISNVTNMFAMFHDASSFNGNISNWNTANVTTMSTMFKGATSFDGNISTWNTAKITSMSNMFNGATSFNQDISTWNVEAVTSMTSMFEGATSFDGNISTWDTANITSMSNMFNGATSFNGNISTWNTAKVTNMSNMFNGTISFNQDISTWNVEAVTNMTDMFTGAIRFSSVNYDSLLTTWSALTQLKSGVTFGAPPTTFCNGASGRTDLKDNHSWIITGDSETASCTDFTLTFNTEAGAPSSTTIILPMSDGAYDIDFDNDGIYGDTDAASKSLTNLTGTQTITFESAGIYTIRMRPNVSNSTKQLRILYNNGNDDLKLTTIEKWGDAIVWTNMSNAFFGCSNLDIAASAGAPNLSIVTEMIHMFWGASSLKADLNTWNVSNVIQMQGAFRSATSFNGNISSWNISNVDSMFAMFGSATSFNGDISNWNPLNARVFSYMFSNAHAFNQDISSWNVSSATVMSLMFRNATSFSSENYDKLLIGWAALGPTNGRNFTAPPTTYCAGSDAKATLQGYGWNIAGDTGLDCSQTVVLDIKMFLKGAYEATSNMMRAELTATHLPTATPHTDGMTTNSNVFDVTGNDAIVDWVYVELRDKNDISTVLHATSALLQRDGDIVDMDGISAVTIAAPADDYYVSVKHRIHIPIATDMTVSLSNTVTNVDLTNVNNIRGGISTVVEVDDGVHALMPGDVDGNGQIQLSDYFAALALIGQPAGYRTADINMDGQVQLSEILTIMVNFIGNGIKF